MNLASAPFATPSSFTRPSIISHRTYVGMYPENSRAGVEASLTSGADGVEADVRATRDGHIVLLHDQSLARTLADPRHIEDVDYSDLLALSRSDERAEGSVPLLTEMLALCAGRLRLVIDVKQGGIAPQLEAVLHAYSNRTETWVWSHDPDIALECVAALRGSVPVSLIVRPWAVGTWQTAEGMIRARELGFSGLLFEHPHVDADLLTRAAHQRIALHCGRTNEPDEIERVLHLGPASMCSDFPERAVAIHDRLLLTAA